MAKVFPFSPLRHHFKIKSHGATRAHYGIHLTLLLILLLWTKMIMASTNSEEFVCGDMDVRNYPENLVKLENCTVIEGHLHILLIDNGTSKQYENMSFPKLREITDYLLLYRAAGITNLGKLFPNLAVIKGRQLFDNYALVIRELGSLQQIGLDNLRVIERGSVRIYRNRHLCFVNTINWNMIAKHGRDGHYIKDNKDLSECPNCHASCPNSGTDVISTTKLNFGDRSGRLCWNYTSCQKICPSECGNEACHLDNGRQCCDDNCLGGCSGESAQECFACKHVYFGGQCIRKCPQNYYMMNDRRCITKDECNALSETRKAKRRDLVFIPFDGDEVSDEKGEKLGKVCLTECPKGYLLRKGPGNQCVPCEGPCPKICKGTIIISSVSTAQFHSGCTEIRGSLVISIDKGGANIATELEKSLKDLEVVTGYVKITRSNPLITLHFFRSLREIHGEEQERKNYSLVVVSNRNLQELFPRQNATSGRKQLILKKGKISFHVNPKLCYQKILELQNYTDIMEFRNVSIFDEHDVSSYSNGDRVACNVEKLNVSIANFDHSRVILHFTNYQRLLADGRALLGYSIYYKKTNKNVTKFDGRDACVNDWKVKDYEGSVGDNSTLEKETYLLTDLAPYSRYALFIDAVTISTEKRGAQSDIIYFTTKMNTPSPPIHLTVLSVSSDEIIVKWEPPRSPNGKIHNYRVAGKRIPDEILPERDYCEQPEFFDNSRRTIPEETLSTQHWITNSSAENKTTEAGKPKECCKCTKDLEETDNEVNAEITFENTLQNAIYVKREETEKSKRSIRSIKPGASNQSLDPKDFSKNETLMDLPYRDEFEKVVLDQKNIIVQNLTHYSTYEITVVACLEKAPRENADACSNKTLKTVRTLPLSGADDIDESTISFVVENGTNFLYIRWDEPSFPNGGVVSYDLEYKIVEDTTAIKVCIKRADYQLLRGYKLANLSPGNYSFRLRSQSFAGWGNWSRSVYFEIPSRGNNLVLIISIIVVFLLIFVTTVVTTFWVCVKRKLRLPQNIEYVSVNPEYISATYNYQPDDWEVERENVKLIKELGAGSFGMVFEGEASELKEHKGQVIRCAVKTLTINDNTPQRDLQRERHNFLQEAAVMKEFQCHHVVRFLGVVSVGHPLYVLMEIMDNGDLRKYLRSQRLDNPEAVNPQPPSLSRIFQMALEIADGMAYLAAKKFVHRDLAARNCMVAGDLTVKIGDFGMTRDIYETDYYTKRGKGLLPVRWMAPESLKDGVFTTQSDVWAYGVVLWEMATLASQPYQGLSNEQVLKYVINSGTMEQPENCPEKLYELMVMCWARNPKARPTFTEIIEMLLPDATSSKFKEVSYYFALRPQMHKKSSQLEEIDPSTPLKSDLKHNDDDSSSDTESGAQTSFKYFPSRTLPVPETIEDETFDIEETEKTDNAVFSENNGINKVNTKMLNENSKSTSDGSKGSKISSTTSNGSIANGHLPRYNTTAC